ncbi:MULTISPECIES: hypothetical protein [unclassified Ruegeria]|uniref:hypothetical protein n=1 Tax=unclassified Ruegeria TaxID=2625375 RepID=UPI001488C978|nr:MULTISPECIES: hypothetical protein [unclassified Ruegeria]
MPAIMIFVGVPQGHSEIYNFAWFTQYSQQFDQGNWLPRHLPEMWAGLGGHDFFFYAPLPFWPISVATSAICSECALVTQIAVGMVFILILSSLTFFVFARCFFGKWPSAVGAVAYSLLPYHLLGDWFIRQAVGEFTAFLFIPVVALGVEKLRRNEGFGWVLALGVAGTSLSHLPTAVLAVPVFGTIVLLISFSRAATVTSTRKFLTNVIFWSALGLLLSCFYWLPSIVLLDSVSSAILFKPYFSPENWLLGWGRETPSGQDTKYVVFVFFFYLPLVLASHAITRGVLRTWTFAPIILVLALNTSLAELFWQIELFSKVQFPWRLLVFSDLAVALSISAIAAHFSQNTKAHLGALIAMVALNLVLLLAIKNKNSQNSIGLDAEAELVSWNGAREYLSPELRSALESRLEVNSLELIDFDVLVQEISVFAKEVQDVENGPLEIVSSSRHLRVKPRQNDYRVVLPIQYWSLWRAETENGIALEIESNPEFGTLDILAAENGFDDGEIFVYLPLHISEKIGSFVSAISCILLLIVSFFGRKRRVLKVKKAG